MAKAASSSPDQNLAVEQYSQLNQEFYSGDPAQYFKSRLHLLMLAAGEADAMGQLLADGVNYEGLIAKVESSELTDETKRHEQAFLTTEAEVLLHHASEALLRLFFAHAESFPCPWLECARLRNFSEFNARVEHLRDAAIPAEQIQRVFLGPVRKELDEALTANVRTLERFLRLVARRVLEDKNLYNATKHGLSVLTGPVSLTLTDDQTGASTGFSGQSITYLEVHTADDKTKTWRRTTRWLGLRDSLWFITLVVAEMTSLWSIAKARYIDADIAGVGVLTAEALDELIGRGTRSGGGITRSSFSLEYYLSQTQA
jgi:hypothetical protein